MERSRCSPPYIPFSLSRSVEGKGRENKRKKRLEKDRKRWKCKKEKMCENNDWRRREEVRSW